MWGKQKKKMLLIHNLNLCLFVSPARLPRLWRVQPDRRWRPKLQSRSILSFLFSKKILTDLWGPKEQMVKNPSIPAVWGPVWPSWIPPNLMSDWDFAAPKLYMSLGETASQNISQNSKRILRAFTFPFFLSHNEDYPTHSKIVNEIHTKSQGCDRVTR